MVNATRFTTLQFSPPCLPDADIFISATPINFADYSTTDAAIFAFAGHTDFLSHTAIFRHYASLPLAGHFHAFIFDYAIVFSQRRFSC
jgi:hypothetical protein